MFRELTPSTPLTTTWIALPRIAGGGTSVGPLGLLLMLVMSLQAVPVSSAAARTIGSLFFMVVSPFARSGTDREGEADRASRRQLAILDTLAVAGVEGGLGID